MDLPILFSVLSFQFFLHPVLLVISILDLLGLFYFLFLVNFFPQLLNICILEHFQLIVLLTPPVVSLYPLSLPVFVHFVPGIDLLNPLQVSTGLLEPLHIPLHHEEIFILRLELLHVVCNHALLRVCDEIILLIRIDIRIGSLGNYCFSIIKPSEFH